MNEFSTQLNQLTVLRNVLNDSVLAPYFKWKSTQNNDSARADFLYALYQKNAQDCFARYLCEVVLYDENAFSVAAASEPEISPYLKEAFSCDLALLLSFLATEEDRAFAYGEMHPFFTDSTRNTVNTLQAFYRENGYGQFAKYTAFRYDSGEIQPICSPSAVHLYDLKGYEREKAEVRDNFESFISGLPYSDMLLYGDRGTGKSSTVHATLNEYTDKKLRLVEIRKEDLLLLPQLKTQLSRIPLKFIVFIDDFSLTEADERFSTLKASLQGSMEGHANNVMIVATSNRRHIVEENFDTRSNSVHANDSQQELLSLSDRFGITVLFSSTNRSKYLEIIHELAKDTNIQTPLDTLDALAERWALARGGRSPRRAKQFLDYVIACEKMGKSINV